MLPMHRELGLDRLFDIMLMDAIHKGWRDGGIRSGGGGVSSGACLDRAGE